jgi:hypothetical protein
VHLFLGGSEIPGWRKMLAEEGVETVSLSYMGLRRRTKFTRPWLIEDNYLDSQKVFLDSGAYTVNKADDDKYSVGELKDIAAHYEAFVQQNIDSLHMVSEFDAVVLGREWIEARREDFYEDLPEDKFLPIWHSEWGVDELDKLAQRYKRVGVTQTDLDGRNLTPVLNEITRKYGTLLHGVAMTKPAEMAAVNWDSVASTSWLSPSQYGDTIVWTGRELKRYPKKYKDQARKRHRTLFTEAGFDADRIEAGENDEVLRFTIWSWQQLAASIDTTGRRKPKQLLLLPEGYFRVSLKCRVLKLIRRPEKCSTRWQLQPSGRTARVPTCRSSAWCRRRRSTPTPRTA